MPQSRVVDRNTPVKTTRSLTDAVLRQFHLKRVSEEWWDADACDAEGRAGDGASRLRMESPAAPPVPRMSWSGGGRFPVGEGTVGHVLNALRNLFDGKVASQDSHRFRVTDKGGFQTLTSVWKDEPSFAAPARGFVRQGHFRLASLEADQA